MTAHPQGNLALATPISAPFTSPTMTSKDIAQLLHKAHCNVLRDIRETLTKAGLADRLIRFEETISRTNPKGGSPIASTIYRLPRAECDLVVSGYSAKYRWAIIQRWHELEAEAEATRKAATPVPTLPIHSRFVIGFDEGRPYSTSIHPDAMICTVPQLVERITDSCGLPPQDVAMLLAACAERLAGAKVLIPTLTQQPTPLPTPTPALKTGARTWRDPLAAEEMLRSMRFKTEVMYALAVITPERVEALFKQGVIGPRQINKLRRLMA